VRRGWLRRSGADRFVACLLLEQTRNAAQELTLPMCPAS
jgi:hypothetical protein